MTELEKMMRGELYDYSDPEALELNIRAHERLERLNSTPYRDTAAYRAALRELIPGFPETSYLIAPFFCDFGFRTQVGEGVVINYNCTFLDGGASRSATTRSSAPTASSTRRSTPLTTSSAAFPSNGDCASRSGTTAGWAAA